MNPSSQTQESLRVEVQRELDSQKSHTERNRLGQFATPPDLALDILRHTRYLLPSGYRIHFLDPAFGTGAFYSALLNVFPLEQIESALGIEIDSQYGQRALDLWGHSLFRLRIADFFALPAPAKDVRKPNLIICNPPYVRHHHIPSAEKEKLQRLIAKTVGLRLNGLAGLYCYFLLYAHTWLQEGGYACWLVPSEFMDVNYGAEIKRYLLEHVTLLRIHRFDATQVQFSDALVSSAVIWFRKSEPPKDHSLEFTFGGSLTKAELRRVIPTSELLKSPKWSQFMLHERTRPANGTSIKLSDFFRIKRGLVTGANNFFIVSQEQVEKFNLPREFLIPVLPSPRFLKQDIIEADEKGDPILEEKLFLLSCDLPESQVKRLYPSLWNYYQIGIERKVHRTYICSHRSPWYSQESRAPCPLLCTYMGRRSPNRNNPFRFILNYSNARAANVYLLLYPKPIVATFIRESPEAIRHLWEALRQISVKSLVGEGRVYGGGLHKLEPRELLNAGAEVVLPSLVNLSGNSVLHDHDLFLLR